MTDEVDLFCEEPFGGALTTFGQPYHGQIYADGTLSLPNGGTLYGVPVTVPNTVLVKFSGLPTPINSALELAYGRELRNDAILFGARRRYAPTDGADGPLEFGAQTSIYRTTDGGIYKVTVNIGAWGADPLPAGGSTVALLTVTVAGQIPGMPSGVIFSESISIDNSWGAPQKEWPWMSYPAPDGTKVLLSIFGGGTQSYPPPHEEGDEYIDADPRYWRYFMHAQEVRIIGGAFDLLPSATVTRLDGSYPAVTTSGDATTVSFDESTGVGLHAEGVASLLKQPVMWRCREDPINGGMVGEFGPGGGYIYGTSAAAKAAWESYVDARAARNWTWAEWIPYTLVPTIWHSPSSTPYPGLGEDWQHYRYFNTGGFDKNNVAWVQADITTVNHSTLEATLALNSRIVTPGPVTGTTKLLACYDNAGNPVVFEVERTTSEQIVSQATLPALTDASVKLGGASRQRHIAERHPTNAVAGRADLHATNSETVKTEVVKLKRNGSTLMEKTLETRTKIEETWGWSAPTTGNTDDLWLWHKRTTTTTHQVGGVQVSKVTTMYDERDTLTPGGGTSPYTFTTVDASVTFEGDESIWGGIGSFDGVRSSNNTAALISNNGRIFGAWSPQSAGSVPDTGQPYDMPRPWVSWNPVTDEFATFQGGCWV